MRLALLAPTSIDIAVLMRSAPTTSPIIDAADRVVGRPADAVDEARDREVPDLQRAGPGEQRQAGEVSGIEQHDEDQRGAPLEPLGAAPRKAPNRPIGSIRSMVSMATMKAEPVRW